MSMQEAANASLSIEKRTTPYEALFRWNEDGRLSGGHVRFITRYIADGVVIPPQLGDALSIDVGGNGGFPLADIMSTIEAGAVATANAAQATAVQLQSERNGLDQQIASLTAALAQAEELRVKAETEVARLRQDRAE